jgi:hypothetical protein
MSAIEARRRWAYRMIQRCQEPPPTYGTREWLALPEGSPERVAAVVVAAENWAREGDDLEQNLRQEIALARAAHKKVEDEEYVQQHRGHREWWSNSGLLELPPPHRRNQPIPPKPVQPLRERMRVIPGEAS